MSTPLELGRLAAAEPFVSYFLVADREQRITGVIEKVASPVLLEKCTMGMSVSELARRDVTFVAEDLSVPEIISRLRGGKFTVALVTPSGGAETTPSEIKGVITEQQLGAAALASAASFSE